MVNKLIVSFTLAFFLASIISYIAEGGGGAYVTYLESAIGATDTTITVGSTDGFTATGTMQIDDEWIKYDDTNGTNFLECNRGENDTDAVAHAKNSKVYTPDAVVLNDAMGFNVSKISTDAGIIALPIIMGKFVVSTVPRLIMWDFSFLKEGPMQWFRAILFCFSAGFVITLSLMIVSAMGGTLLGIFSRR